jgi:DnaK suppressor protein
MDIEEIREKIRAEIVKTESVIVDYEELTKPISPDDSIGRLTRMDAIQNKSVAEAALRQSRDKLNKLRYALSHLDDPEFGKCAKCGNKIPVGRILLRPESPYCVHCAQ